MAVEKISNKKAKDILETYGKLSIYNSALETLKSYMLDTSTMKEEVAEKYREKIKELSENTAVLEEEYYSHLSKVQNKFNRTNCILKVKDNWYCVLVLNDLGNRVLLVMPIHDQSLACKRLEDYNPAAVGYMTKEELSALVSKEDINEDLLLGFQSNIATEAYEGILKEFFESVEVKQKDTYSISKHAIIRWKERKENCSRKEKQKLEDDTVIELILESFTNSEKVWENVEGNQDILNKKVSGIMIEYYYNKDDNTMFVVSGNDKHIITLYEEDFGFCKEINVKTTLMQIEHVKTQYDIAVLRDKELKESYLRLNVELEALNKEKQELESMLATVSSTIKYKKEQMTNVDSMRNTMKNGIQRELDLLFKKHK